MTRKSKVVNEFSGQLPAKELATLLHVGGTLASSLDLPYVLQTAVDSTVRVLGLDTGAIYQLEEGLLCLGATTPPLEPAMSWLLAISERLENHPHLQQALTLIQPVSISDTEHAVLSEAEAAVCRARHLKAILYIPLVLENQALGALIVGTTTTAHRFSEHELDLCRMLAYQITLAVANARLFKSVREFGVELAEAYDETLLGWSLALEMRDQDTQGHTQRVMRLAEALGESMGVEAGELVHLRRGALLHDIGKMSVPDEILKKEGPLSADEQAIMRKHPEYAYQFLKHIKFLTPALDIPYCHHEKWDGSGYPRGLAGEAIPLAARIFAVPDVYDALTSDRTYRKALPQQVSVEYIKGQAGKYFDPQVVKVFLEKVIGSS